MGISFLQTLFSFFVPGGVLVLAISFILLRGLPTITLPLLIRIYPEDVYILSLDAAVLRNGKRAIFLASNGRAKKVTLEDYLISGDI